MALFAHKGGAWLQTTPWVRKAGVWKMAAVSGHKSGAWKDNLAPLSAGVDAPSLYAEDTSPPTTGTVTNTPAGGASPYTYAWTFDSSDGGISITSPTSAATTFVGNTMDPGTTRNAIARCTVTDSLGATAYALVAMTLVRDYPT